MSALEDAGEARQHGNTYPLLATLIATIGIAPFATDGVFRPILSSGLMSCVIIAGVWGVSHRRRILWVLVPLGTLAVLLLGLGLMNQSRSVAALSFFVGWLTTTAVGASVLLGVFQSPRITLSSVSGGVCCYLLLGISWALAFALLESFQPGSFLRGGEVLAKGSRGVQELIYYAFVTLSTLGFGDISPATPPAEGMSVLSAITGQLYLAILIAALVSRFAIGDDSTVG